MAWHGSVRMDPTNMDPTWSEIFFVRRQLTSMQKQQQALTRQEIAIKDQLRSLGKQKSLLTRNTKLVQDRYIKLTELQLEMVGVEDRSREQTNNLRARCMDCGNDFGSEADLITHGEATGCAPWEI